MMADKNILVLDNDRQSSGLLKRNLTEKDYSGAFDLLFKITIAHTVEDCIQSLQSNSFHLIIMDLKFSNFSGLDIFYKIYKDYSATPIIIYTDIDDEEQAVKALENGASHYIVRGSIDSQELIRIMADVINDFDPDLFL